MHRIAPCAPYLPRRASDTNKYDYGRVLIVGGCIGYTGAPTHGPEVCTARRFARPGGLRRNVLRPVKRKCNGAVISK